MTSIRWLCGLLLCAALLQAGCNRGPKRTFEERNMVEGMVTLDGSPLAKGRILFESPEDAVLGVPPGSGPIKQGRYQVSVSMGTKTVRIFAPQATGEADEMGLTPTKETLPAIYNNDSTLVATISTDGPRTFDFELSSSVKKTPRRR
jgi:hypothetical protein